MLFINSEEPLAQASRIGLNSRRTGVRWNARPCRFLKKRMGMIPPTHWLSTVATAAPATPKPKPTMKRASSIMFVEPAASVM